MNKIACRLTPLHLSLRCTGAKRFCSAEADRTPVDVRERWENRWTAGLVKSLMVKINFFYFGACSVILNQSIRQNYNMGH